MKTSETDLPLTIIEKGCPGKGRSGGDMLGNQSLHMTSRRQGGDCKHRGARVSEPDQALLTLGIHLGQSVPIMSGFENQHGLTLEALKISKLNSGRAEELQETKLLPLKSLHTK